jgi:hypothetical protein
LSERTFPKQAVNHAKTADHVVLAVGQDITMAGEGHDSKNISLTDAQSALIAEVAAAAKQPVVVILLRCAHETKRLIAN